jgi:hypothetical protein
MSLYLIAANIENFNLQIFPDVVRRYKKIEVSNVDWKHLVTESEHT